MIIKDERQLLPIVRDAATGREYAIAPFVEAISPLFEVFLTSGLEKNIYEGYTFGLSFFKPSMPECEPYLSALSATDSSWLFFNEGKDSCTCVVPGKGIIKIILCSFLWYFY